MREHAHSIDDRSPYFICGSDTVNVTRISGDSKLRGTPALYGTDSFKPLWRAAVTSVESSRWTRVGNRSQTISSTNKGKEESE